MSDLTPELASDIVTACQAGIEEIAAALSRCLDGPFTLSVGEPSPYAAEVDSPRHDGPGLAISLKFGPFGLAAVLPESSGLLPDWYTDPDPTGESKLNTLAQELSMLLVPETLMADTFTAARVEPLNEALRRTNMADDAVMVPLNLESGERSGQLRLIWPLTQPDALLSVPARSEDKPDPPDTAEAPAKNSGETDSAEADSVEADSVEADFPETDSTETGARQGDIPSIDDFSQLPGFSRSLLRIEVPVSVRLASKKESVQEIIELAPGSIIKFDKACDQPLHLYVSDQEVAAGEAVKIGDHFGFRLNQMLMPKEHFHPVRRPETSGPG